MKTNFEEPQLQDSEAVADDSIVDEDKPIERDPRLVSLWKKYKFMGEPPVKGTPVEKRLYDTCERYMKYATGNEMYERPVTPRSVVGFASMKGDSENYFAQQPQSTPKSDSSRRELHNQIALMVVGAQRSGMSTVRAEQIADFACELVNGCTIAEYESTK